MQQYFSFQHVQNFGRMTSAALQTGLAYMLSGHLPIWVVRLYL